MGDTRATLLRDPSLKDLRELVQALELGAISGNHVIMGDKEANWQQFLSLFAPIEAAGGLVTDGLGRWLFIHRMGRWDLPKGKIDSYELPEQAAVREVSEECGIRPPAIIEPIIPTYHVYTQHSQRLLKLTHWYLMRSLSHDTLRPQAEEGITEATWVSTERAAHLAAQSYQSVRGVIHEGLRMYGCGRVG